jgi:tetratricopeptide (TPR) repeat protein
LRAELGLEPPRRATAGLDPTYPEDLSAPTVASTPSDPPHIAPVDDAPAYDQPAYDQEDAFDEAEIERGYLGAVDAPEAPSTDRELSRLLEDALQARQRELESTDAWAGADDESLGQVTTFSVLEPEAGPDPEPPALLDRAELASQGLPQSSIASTVADNLDDLSRPEMPPTVDRKPPTVDGPIANEASAPRISQQRSPGEIFVFAVAPPWPRINLHALARRPLARPSWVAEAPAPAPLVTHTLAELYLEQGHAEEAQRLFGEILEQSPQDPAARSGLERARASAARLDARALLAGHEEATRGTGLSEKQAYVLRRYVERLRGGEGGHAP